MPTHALRFLVAASVLLALPARAQSSEAQLFTGTVRGARVDVIVLPRDHEVLAASYRPPPGGPAAWDLPLPPARLLTGTRTGSRYTLHEWNGRGNEMATIVAEPSGDTLSGTWQARGEAAARFVFRRDPSPFGGGPPGSHSDLTSQYRIAAPVIDRLHDAVRASRWADARFEAQLLCVVTFAAPTPDGCGWIDAVDALAAGREPAPMVRAGWIGLVLERQNQYARAFEAHRSSCWATRSSCAFMLDLLDRVEPDKRRPALRLACKSARLACQEYWGGNEVALVDAARRGDLETAARLIKGGVNVDAGGEGQLRTPLQAAVLARSLPIVQALLQAGANPNRTGAEEGTGVGLPLEYAIGHSFDDIAMWLVEHGAKANASKDALVMAVRLRKRALVARILENGEDPDMTRFDGDSALQVAVENRDLQLVKALVSHGADPDFKGKFSDGSSIELAGRTGQTEMLRILLDARARRRDPF